MSSAIEMNLYFQLLLIVTVYVKIQGISQPFPVPVHRLLSRHERSILFASTLEVPNYEVVYLTVDNHRPKREASTCERRGLNLTAFGQKLQLLLNPNDGLNYGDFLVTSREGKSSFVLPHLSKWNGTCHYHGKVLSLPGGRTAVSINKGYTGIIARKGASHLIFHPLPQRIHERYVNSENLMPHIIYEKKNLPEDSCRYAINVSSPTKESSRFPRRVFRTSNGKLNIETAVFVDRDLFLLMQQNFPADPDRGTVDVVLTMVNAAQLLFQDPSLGSEINLALVRLEIQKTEIEELRRTGNIDHYLSSFCTWQSKINPTNDVDPLHWDHALLLTGSDVYSEDETGVRNQQVVGLAPVSGMCLHGNSCTVNEGGHFESVYVIAHEMGHSMGMQHDGPQNNNPCDKNKYIMSPTLGSGKTTWSSCSRNYLLKFLRLPQSRCLWDVGSTPERLNHVKNVLLPGQRFNADQQCRLRFGAGSSRSNGQPLETICQDLQCVSDRYVVSSHPALEGTQCGNNKYCRRGECIVKPATTLRPKPVDGGWGEWTPFSPCISGCLSGNDGSLETGSVGTRISYRICNNPHPENGGNPCKGKDKRYELCSIPQICGESFKTTINSHASDLCSKGARQNRELSGVGFQKTDVDPESACSVWCKKRSGEMFTSKNYQFPEGTICQMPGTRNPSYCINGLCTEFGCDGREIDETRVPFCNLKNLTKYLVSMTISPKNWEATSSCMFGCMYGGRGMRTVQNKCSLSEQTCNNNTIYVQLCDNYEKCLMVQTASEYAMDICQTLRKTYSQISGHGVQLPPQDDDPHLPCYVSCQDSLNSTKYYKIDNIPSGMFPVGTDCKTRNNINRKLCLQGQCYTFGEDDISTSSTYEVSHVFRRDAEEIYRWRHLREQWKNLTEINEVRSKPIRFSSSNSTKTAKTFQPQKRLHVISFSEALANKEIKQSQPSGTTKPPHPSDLQFLDSVV